jgi:hypothetical protein
MCWLKSNKWKKGDGKLQHPANARHRINFDKQYPNFGDDPINVCFVLSTDVMNWFGERVSSRCTWLVIFMIYNFPTWLC